MDRRRPVALPGAIKQKRRNLPRESSWDEKYRHGIREDRLSQVAVVALQAVEFLLRRIVVLPGRKCILLGNKHPRFALPPSFGPFAMEFGQGCGTEAIEIASLAKVFAFL